MNLLIAVPSYNRSQYMMNQLTLHTLVKAGFKPTLFVRKSEEHTYSPIAREYDIPMILAEEYEISDKRNFIVSYAHACCFEKVYILDDDLRFSYRETAYDKLKNSGPEQVRDCVDALYTACNCEAPLVGARIRAFANNAQENWSVAQRIIFNQMVHVPTFRERGWSFKGPDMRTKGDLYCQLAILTSGCATLSCNLFALDSSLSDEHAGGCGTFRTNAVRNADSEKLHALFPDFVQLKSKYDDQGEPYTDVTIYFKKAYEYGISRRES